MEQSILVIPGITDPSTLARIARARNYKYYCMLVDDELAGRCPFCNINPEINKILIDGKHWQAWQNPVPEKNTRHHFIIAPKRHYVGTDELTGDEWQGLFRVMESLRQTYNYQSRGILIRDGDATLSAGTIEHLHVHVIVPDGTGRVESPFYKGAEDEILGIKRAIVFEKLRTGTPLSDLSFEEQELIKGRIR